MGVSWRLSPVPRLVLGAVVLCLGLACGLLPSLLPESASPSNEALATRHAVPTLEPAFTAPATLVAEPEALATPSQTSAPTAEMRARHRRVFRYVWKQIDRYYLYPDFNGVDWRAVRETYAPKVDAALDDAAFWWLMIEMVDTLGDEHSGFLTPEEVAAEDAAASGDLDYVGIGIYVSLPEDYAYGIVLLPIPGGPAEQAGVRAHDRILSIDGVPMCCTPEGWDNLHLLDGEAGTEVSLVLAYPGEAEREVTVVRQRIQGQLPLMPRILVEGEHTFAYILIPTLWDETIGERTRETLTDLLSGRDGAVPEGMVIDMRVNGGGAYTELYDLLSLFVSGDVGAFRRRGSGSQRLVIDADPVGSSQSIPLVVLVGVDTESYAEVFSGALQALGRAQLVGQPTAGNVETVYPYDMEDGSRLWLAEETFEPPDGTRWEGAGVQPDVLIPGKWEDFSTEVDPQLQVAVDLLVEILLEKEE